jgi:hypothetical protein
MKNFSKGSIIGTLLLIIVVVFVGLFIYGYVKAPESVKKQETATTTASTSVRTAVKSTSSSASKSEFSEMTLVIQKMNGSFTAANVWNATDASGTKWQISFGDALFYYENTDMDPPTWPGDINAWLSQSKTALSSGKFDSSQTSIKIVGTAGSSGTFTASSIIQEVQ